MHYSCRNLTRSCKNCFIRTSFFQDFNVYYKILARIALSSQCFFIAENVSETFLTLLTQNSSKNLAVDSEPSVSRRFRKRHERSYPKARDKVTLGKNCFTFYFYSDKLSHYKTYVFRKFLNPDAFKHVRLQNTFNRCKVHLILPLTFEYAYFLVKCINYQNVMCMQKIYFLQDLARFLWKMHSLQGSRNTTHAKFLQKNEKVLQDYCKNFARFTFKFTNVARYVFSAQTLQKNFARFFEKLFFL